MKLHFVAAGLVAFGATTQASAEIQSVFFAQRSLLADALDVHCSYIQDTDASPGDATQRRLQVIGGRTYRVQLGDGAGSADLPSEELLRRLRRVASDLCPNISSATAASTNREPVLIRALNGTGAQLQRSAAEAPNAYSHTFSLSRDNNQCKSEGHRMLRNVLGANTPSVSTIDSACERISAAALTSGGERCLAAVASGDPQRYAPLQPYCRTLANFSFGGPNATRMALANLMAQAYRGNAGCDAWERLGTLRDLEPAEKARIANVFGAEASSSVISAIELINHQCATRNARGPRGTRRYVGDTDPRVPGSDRRCGETWSTAVEQVTGNLITENQLRGLCSQVRTWRANYYSACHVSNDQFNFNAQSAPANIYNARLLACRCQFHFGRPGGELVHALGMTPTERFARRINASPFGGFIPGGDRCDAYRLPFSGQRRDAVPAGHTITRENRQGATPAR